MQLKLATELELKLQCLGCPALVPNRCACVSLSVLSFLFISMALLCCTRTVDVACVLRLVVWCSLDVVSVWYGMVVHCGRWRVSGGCSEAESTIPATKLSSLHRPCCMRSHVHAALLIAFTLVFLAKINTILSFPWLVRCGTLLYSQYGVELW